MNAKVFCFVLKLLVILIDFNCFDLWKEFWPAILFEPFDRTFSYPLRDQPFIFRNQINRQPLIDQTTTSFCLRLQSTVVYLVLAILKWFLAHEHLANLTNSQPLRQSIGKPPLCLASFEISPRNWNQSVCRYSYPLVWISPSSAIELRDFRVRSALQRACHSLWPWNELAPNRWFTRTSVS